MKIQKLSSLALYAVILIAVVCFALFFSVGYAPTPEQEVAEDFNKFDWPQHTNTILYLMYGTFAITAILAIWSLIKGVALNMGNKGPNPSGIPSGLITTCVWVGTLAVLVVFYLIAPTAAEPFVTSSGAETSVGMLKVVDMFLPAIYTLFVITVVAVIISMSGVLSKGNTRK